jgi:general nucleoside transport system permease protein
MVELFTNLLSITVLYATPLILAASGGLFSERAGVINIGLEGLMTIGAFTAVVGTLRTGNPWFGFLFAVLSGVLLALLHAIASVSLQADQVVSGVAINFLAIGLSVYFMKDLYEGAGQTPVVQTKLNAIALPGLSQIPLIGPSFFTALPTTYIALGVVCLSYFLLYRTVFGMRLRAVGEHPHAAETAGVSVIFIRYMAVLLSGALAAMGGAGLSIAIGSEFSQTTVAGQGFIALAALIFGKWRPFSVLGACLFFGFAVALALTGQLFRWTQDIPSEVLNMLPYVMTILALAGFVGRAEAPAAIGKSYKKG